MRDLNTHNGALEHLVYHLDILELHRKKIAWVVKEPLIFRKDTMYNEIACDIVVGYNEPYNHVDLIELKHSKASRGKARKQIENTEKHLTSYWNYPIQNKYIVYYPTWEYEIVS